MNRKIKFRVWDEAGKYFLYFNLEEIPHGCATCVAPPQQFTGLKDKNGKEIYEGDIIKTQIYEDWDAVPCGYCNYEVKWSLVELAWRGYTNKMNGLYSGVNIFKDVLIEVVGNIFENPELLDNGKKFIKDVHKKIGWES
jgi:hypothetical protein